MYNIDFSLHSLHIRSPGTVQVDRSVLRRPAGYAYGLRHSRTSAPECQRPHNDLFTMADFAKQLSQKLLCGVILVLFPCHELIS